MHSEPHSITINIDEYFIILMFFDNHRPYIYMYISITKNHATGNILYWARFYQKDNQYILRDENGHIGIELDYVTKQNAIFRNLLKEAYIIELIGDNLCIRNHILLQLI